MGTAAQDFLALKKELQLERILELECEGQSMEPLIRHGDSVKVVPAARLKPFDIIVFLNQDTLVCHYVARVQVCRRDDLEFPKGSKVYLSQGLANWFGDPLPVGEDMILGVVENYRLNVFARFKCWMRGRRGH